ncbi:MAG: hypothetical protein IT383_24495 [Deltaproteobacteria bacterium]|nr:hypothetical protein [Deltaproteobacteria bacterium]
MLIRALPVALTISLGLAGCSSCTKDEKQADTKERPDKGPKTPTTPPQPAAPPPGTDADLKRAAALALAKTVDDGLAGFSHVEKDLAAGADGKGRAAEAWHVGKVPKKLVLKVKDATGVVADSTDVYYDDAGHMAFVRAPDGLFVFNMEALALWLDREQRVKRGVSPGDARTRAEQLRAEAAKALVTLGVR